MTEKTHEDLCSATEDRCRWITDEWFDEEGYIGETTYCLYCHRNWESEKDSNE